MATVDAKLVKELRDITGAGFMDCKKALVATDGNIEAAIEEMRKSGALKAAKKATRVAAEGIIACAHEGNDVVLLEVNSETDFAAKNAEFVEFANKAAKIALDNKCADVEALKACAYADGQTVAEALTALIAKIGENLALRRLSCMSGDNLGVYVHSNKHIGVVVSLKGGDAEVAKNVAMQVAALKPIYTNDGEVDDEYKAHELEIIKSQIENDPKMAGKPEKVISGAVMGRLNKQLKEICLMDQVYVKAEDGKQTVAAYVAQVAKANNANIVIKGFVRFETGEGLEKKNEDFAAEVATQMNM